MGERFRTILLFGAPGAGKGTQGKILGAIPGFFHLSCGEVFRSLDMTSALGKVFVEFSSRGELVPDDATVKMWQQNMKAQTVLGRFKPRQDLLVLDGIPRNVHQARLLRNHLDVLLIVHLICPDKERMFERLRRRALKENRVDDAREDVIRRRWQVYEQETYPVLRAYPREVIREIDAMGSPASVLQHILEAVVPVQDAHFANLSSQDPAPAPAKTRRPSPPARSRAGSNGKLHPPKRARRTP